MWIFVIILKREFMTQWRDTLFFGDVIFDHYSFVFFNVYSAFPKS